MWVVAGSRKSLESLCNPRSQAEPLCTRCAITWATRARLCRYELLIHDRDCIFASHLDESIRRLGIRVLKSPPRCPKANAICERVIATIRRECLDWLIPCPKPHLRFTLKTWIAHYNGGRPHMALGPGVPDPPVSTIVLPSPPSRHRRGESYAVRAKPVLGGLHHEYSLAAACA
jgi:putative transposase